MFGFLDMMGNYETRKVDRYDGESLMVSTAAVTDGDYPFETAILHPDYNDGNHVIVEAYDDREAAQSGHDKWVKIMTGDPLPDKLRDCANAAVAKFIGEEDFPRVTP